MIPKTLDKEWIELLGDEFTKPYFAQIIAHYKAALESKQIIFPQAKHTFYALNLTPPSRVRIVIIGQDPYHGSVMVQGQEIPQAMGLSFSVPNGVPPPPSLRNIYQELHKTLGIKIPNTGDLSVWAKRGALMLNAILSVEKGKAGSHKHFGWEHFTNAIITKLCAARQGIVFMLWGNYARSKAHLIDERMHKIIQAPHPSPLAKGFIGSGVFVQAQKAFLSMGQEPFDWNLES